MTAGRLYGVGIGPGDPELMTIKATRVIANSPVIAFFAKAGRRGNARGIVDQCLKPSHVELPLYYPMTTEFAFRRPALSRGAGEVLPGKRGGDRRPSRRGPRRRAAQRRRSALLRFVHASVRPPARALRRDDRAGRVLDLRRLGRGRDGDDLGRRFACRASGDPAARPDDAPPRPRRRRRHHEDRTQFRRAPGRRSRGPEWRSARSMSSVRPWRARASCRLARRATSPRPTSR